MQERVCKWEEVCSLKGYYRETERGETDMTERGRGEKRRESNFIIYKTELPAITD